MKVLFLFCILLFGLKNFAQVKPEDKIKTIKTTLQKRIERNLPSVPDSISAVCDRKYIAALDSIKSIYALHNKMEMDYPFEELWKMGTTANGSTASRNALINVILQEKDSVLYAALNRCNLLVDVPPRQTECCAIKGYTDYDSSKSKNIDPLVIAALSINNEFQNFNYQGLEKDHKTALLRMIDNELVNHELKYASKNGYTKLFPLVDSLVKQNNSQKDIVVSKQQQKKQPIWLWLLGGFILAVILFFILNKKAK